MHLLLTDRLSCPRCGPSFGLILLAHDLRNRIVKAGTLGCPNCRDSFSIEDGFADLRAPPRGPLPPGLAGPPGSEDPEVAARVMALLGIVAGPGAVALVGEPARLAREVAATLSEVQVVAVDPDMRRWDEVAGVSRIAAGPGLPFFSAALRAAAVDGRLGRAVLAEAVRVVAPRGRLVVLHAPDWTELLLRDAGLSVLAAEAGTVVVARG